MANFKKIYSFLQEGAQRQDAANRGIPDSSSLPQSMARLSPWKEHPHTSRTLGEERSL